MRHARNGPRLYPTGPTTNSHFYQVGCANVKLFGSRFLRGPAAPPRPFGGAFLREVLQGIVTG